MKAQATFFHQGQELYQDCEPYMTDIANQVSGLVHHKTILILKGFKICTSLTKTFNQHFVLYINCSAKLNFEIFEKQQTTVTPANLIILTPRSLFFTDSRQPAYHFLIW